MNVNISLVALEFSFMAPFAHPVSAQVLVCGISMHAKDGIANYTIDLAACRT